MYRCALAGLVTAVGLSCSRRAVPCQFLGVRGDRALTHLDSNSGRNGRHRSHPFQGHCLSLFLNLDKQAGTLEYTLVYANVGTTAPNTGTVTQAHIHFGKHHVAGGIIVFFCTNLNNGPKGTQTCPANGGTVTGTLTAADVVGPAAQNIPALDFDGLVAALEHDTAYGNIHTTHYTAGEIRGQIKRCEEDNCLYNLPPAGNGQGDNGQGNQN